LHKVRLHKKPRLAAAGAADYKDIFIPCVLWLLRAATHHQPFGLGQNDVVFKHRVYIRLYILGVAPTCRTVFHAAPIFFRVLALEIDNQPDKHRPRYADKQVHRV